MNNKKGKERYNVLFQHYRRFLKNLLRNYFVWEGLPDTIDERAHEDLVLFNGYDVGFRYNGDIIVANGALSGIDLYQRPTQFVSANPKIVPTQLRTPLKDCVPCYNTKNYAFGENCNTLVNIFADLLANLSISVRTSVRNSRVVVVPTVKDDKEAIRVSELMEEIYDGDSYALAYEIGELNGNNLFPIKARDNIVVAELADARRNILSDFFAETGVRTIAVDKRERTNLLEMESNDDQIHIANEIMLAPRRLWAEQMNKMFNTNISVRFNEEVIKNVNLSQGLE